jgi:hypothetical protein
MFLLHQRKTSKQKNPRIKTECHFFIIVAPAKRWTSEDGLKILLFHLEHTGPALEPTLFIEKTLSTDIIPMIQTLYQSGATPMVIKKFLSSMNLPSLTTSQLTKITTKP